MTDTTDFTDSERKFIGEAVRLALANLGEINAIPHNPNSDNKTGLLKPGDRVFRAGGDYDSPWTRDAAINSWNAGSRLFPHIARNTLMAVCEKCGDGSYIVQQDNQTWDQVIWIPAALNHCKEADDREFLEFAYGVSVNTYRRRRELDFDAEFGMFKGGSVMNDGIAGYPSPPMDPSVKSSFAPDHVAVRSLMCCSTNAIYCLALDALAEMSVELGKDSSAFRADRAALGAAINRHLWIPEKSRWGYFLHGAGEMRGRLDESQEALGMAFCSMAGLAPAGSDPFAKVHVEPYGVTTSWPHFAPYSAEKPGRHNGMVWPMISGFWGDAAYNAGHAELWRKELLTIAKVAVREGQFPELWTPQAGVPDSGAQHFDAWKACRDQTWSASAFLRLEHLPERRMAGPSGKSN